MFSFIPLLVWRYISDICGETCFGIRKKLFKIAKQEERKYIIWINYLSEFIKHNRHKDFVTHLHIFSRIVLDFFLNFLCNSIILIKNLEDVFIIKPKVEKHFDSQPINCFNHNRYWLCSRAKLWKERENVVVSRLSESFLFAFLRVEFILLSEFFIILTKNNLKRNSWKWNISRVKGDCGDKVALFQDSHSYWYRTFLASFLATLELFSNLRGHLFSTASQHCTFTGSI